MGEIRINGIVSDDDAVLCGAACVSSEYEAAASDVMKQLLELEAREVYHLRESSVDDFASIQKAVKEGVTNWKGALNAYLKIYAVEHSKDYSASNKGKYSRMDCARIAFENVVSADKALPESLEVITDVYTRLRRLEEPSPSWPGDVSGPVGRDHCPTVYNAGGPSCSDATDYAYALQDFEVVTRVALEKKCPLEESAKRFVNFFASAGGIAAMRNSDANHRSLLSAFKMAHGLSAK